MSANRKSIIASAAALLLAIAAAITPAGCNLDHTDYTHSFKADGHVITVWGKKPACSKPILNLMDGRNYSDDLDSMLFLLVAQSQSSSDSKTLRELDQIASSKKLVAYSRTGYYPCYGLDIIDFLMLVSKCGNEDRYQRYFDFMIHHAPRKFAPCARQLIENYSHYPYSMLAAANQFFRAGLDLGNEELSDQEMFDKVKEVDLLTTKFNIPAMIQVAKVMLGMTCACFKYHDRVAQDLQPVLTRVKDQFYPNVNIVNVARGLGIIGAGELTPRFKLVNKYVGFAFQMEHHRHFRAIEKHLKLK